MRDEDFAATEPPRSWPRTLVRFWGLRRVHQIPRSSALGLLLTLWVLWLAVWAVIDWRQRGPDPVFSIEGVPLFGWYALAVLALAAWLRSRSTPRPSLEVTLVLATGLVPFPLLLMGIIAEWVSPPWFGTVGILVAFYAMVYLARGLRAITGVPQRLAAVSGVAFVVAFAGLSDRLDAIPDIWSPADVSPQEVEAALSDEQLAQRESVLFEQSDRIDQALQSVRRDASLRPQSFFLGFAGVGDERVFAGEIGLAARVIGERYTSGRRRVALINDETNLDGAPLASVSGLQHALRGLAGIMKLDRDVLFLAISSHGSADPPAIAVANSQFPFTDLSPDDLADALHESGIEWRVIIISACYAGGFIEALRDPHAIVITAAAADRTSFGCSNDRDLTYFGEAFYRDALPGARSLREAFEKAKVAIVARERAEGETPSNPQAFFGSQIEEHLAQMGQAVLPHGDLRRVE